MANSAAKLRIIFVIAYAWGVKSNEKHDSPFCVLEELSDPSPGGRDDRGQSLDDRGQSLDIPRKT